ncbi:hypothetical protein ACOMHN_007680 [Nucella lapillus]
MWVHLQSHGHRLVSRVNDHLENIQPGLARKVDHLEDIQPGLARKVFGGVFTGAAVSYLAVRGYRYYRSRQIGKERGCAAKQACQNLKDYLAEKEQEEGPVDRAKEDMIISLSLKALKEKLRKGELKALEVLRAYQRKVSCIESFLILDYS